MSSGKSNYHISERLGVTAGTHNILKVSIKFLENKEISFVSIFKSILKREHLNKTVPIIMSKFQRYADGGSNVCDGRDKRKMKFTLLSEQRRSVRDSKV